MTRYSGVKVTRRSKRTRRVRRDRVYRNRQGMRYSSQMHRKMSIG